ncbi:pyridoxal phosphate-dependent aminotransferase [Okeania hirsuta]|uniref:Aminotransferase n=1 Tax=Okeania hirsuta TaxID=1458930 RepID=A0A3N6PNB1_9CYAN|nr:MULTISPECIES: pyridoxal phosphate-dependent aminotransferase [Okeania]NET79675.1 pyridoxal phosphate-dependent aminotransferase [Okeania sp. SIO1F9]RQH32393.1 pyridoxal phosphate-dependent aminotransferase [Okeania hirsuta]
MPSPILTFPPMGIDKISTLLARNQSHCPPISLAFGQSEFPIQKYVDLTLQAKDLEKVLGYGDIGGQISLREKISSFYASILGVELPVSQILITDGATGALVLALGLLVRPGSEVIIPAVGYAAYPRIVKMFGGIPISAPLDAEFNLLPHRLADLINAKTAAIILNSPGNPHGNIASLEILAEIASFGIPVIFDEVYQLMTFAGDFAPSGTQLPGEHFVANGFSKSFAVPGLRIGFLIVPPSYAEAAESVKVLLNICPNLIGQLLAERLLEQAPVLLKAHQSYLRPCHNFFLATCDRNSVPTLRNSQAGFYGIIELPEGMDSMTAASILAKDYAVATAPGKDFAETDPGFLRVNFTKSGQDVSEGVRRIAEFLAKVNPEHLRSHSLGVSSLSLS